MPELRNRASLAVFSATALPLVVVITTLGVAADKMHPSTAAALVGAGMLSVVVFPPVAMAIARVPDAQPPPDAGPRRAIDDIDGDDLAFGLPDD